MDYSAETLPVELSEQFLTRNDVMLVKDSALKFSLELSTIFLDTSKRKKQFPYTLNVLGDEVSNRINCPFFSGAFYAVCIKSELFNFFLKGVMLKDVAIVEVTEQGNQQNFSVTGILGAKTVWSGLV